MSTINFPLTTTSLFVNTLNTNKIIYLPAASTINAGRLFYIKDICGNAAASSIYIYTTGMDRIENRSSIYAHMSTNYGSVLMAPDGALNWYFLQHYYKNALSIETVPGTVTATGGTITTYGSYKVHSFTTVGTATFTITSPASVSINYLVVAGGGGGGVGRGGGGGAGGVLTGTTTLSSGSYTITVGAGGSNAFNDVQGGDGGSSSIGSIIVTTGGGGGGAWNARAGRNGGSGGGASAGDLLSGGTGVSGQGYAGSTRASDLVGGGGGGAGGAGSGSTGGIGITSMITGTTTYYAGGGGAGSVSSGASPGVAFGGTYQVANGTYGGGNGGNTPGTNQPYQNAVANTGGGGGGQEGYAGNSGFGGSGIVIISYLRSSIAFSPMSIPGIQLWYDAADPLGTGTAPSLGTSITTWNDKSGNVNHATGQVSAVTASDSTGSYLNFTGSTYYTIGSGAFIANQYYTIFIVERLQSSSPSQQHMIGNSSLGPGNAALHIRYVNTTTLRFANFYNDLDAANIPAFTTADAQPTRILTFSQLPSSRTAYINSTSFGSDGNNTLLSAWAQPLIGQSFGGEYYTGRMREILFYTGQLTTIQRQMIEGYLAHKWSLQASLPANHPYKSTTLTGTTFSPSSMISLQLWLDAADQSSITLSGSSVTTWNDKSGNGYNFTQSTSGNRPTYSVTSQNNRNTITFTSANSTYLVGTGTTNFMGTNSISVYGIFKTNNNTTTSSVFAKSLYGSASGRILYGFRESGTPGNINGGIGVASGPNAYTNISDTYSVGTWRIFGFVSNRSGWTNTTYQNGTSVGTITITSDTTTNLTNTYPMIVGGYNNSTGGVSPPQAGYYLDGGVGELLVFNSALTTYERQRVEGYLAWKWGIQTSLPAGHPYLSAAPVDIINPIANGLRYQFDAAKNVPTTSGWTDANAYGNLTFFNSPPVTSGAVNYVSFNGTSQYGSSVDMTNLTAFTITMWIRTTSTTNNGTFYLKPHLIGQGSGGNASRDFGLTTGGGYAGIWSGIGSTDTQNQSETNTSAANYIANGLWHELTVTSSYTNGSRLYVNGTQFGSALAVSQNTESGQNWFIGATNYLAGGPNAWAAADVSVILLYTRELSAVEVSSNFNTYRSRFGR